MHKEAYESLQNLLEEIYEIKADYLEWFSSTANHETTTYDVGLLVGRSAGYDEIGEMIRRRIKYVEIEE